VAHRVDRLEAPTAEIDGFALLRNILRNHPALAKAFYLRIFGLCGATTVECQWRQIASFT
jgi:hypothetical protein